MSLSAPLSRDGLRIDRLYDGWREVARAPLGPDLTGLVLERVETGQTVCWYVDAAGAVISTHAAFLDGAAREALFAFAGPWAAPLAATSLADTPRNDSGAGAGAAPRLHETLLTEIASVWAVNLLDAITVFPATWAQTGGTLAGPSGIAIEEQRVAALVGSRRSEGALVVSSPFTGSPLRAQIVIATGGLAIHRFHDTQQGSAFYLAWSDAAPAARPAFFCPHANLIVSDLPDPAFLPGRLIAWYASHPEHAEMIAAAIPFQPEDYGLGRASALGDLEPEETQEAPEDADATAQGTSDSAAWALLRKGGANLQERPAAVQAYDEARPGFFRRLLHRDRRKD